jgi:hypothetical protein
MATPIVVNPIKPSAVLVESNNKSGTPIHIDDSIDWGKVEGIVADEVAGAVQEMAVDDHLSAVSTNAVQNKVIYKKLNEMMNLLYAAL